MKETTTIKSKPQIYGDTYHLMVAQDLLRCHLGMLEWEKRFDDYEEMFEFVCDTFQNWQVWDVMTHAHSNSKPWIDSFTYYINNTLN
jgi:hypothetical protein